MCQLWDAQQAKHYIQSEPEPEKYCLGELSRGQEQVNGQWAAKCLGNNLLPSTRNEQHSKKHLQQPCVHMNRTRMPNTPTFYTAATRKGQRQKSAKSSHKQGPSPFIPPIQTQLAKEYHFELVHCLSWSLQSHGSLMGRSRSTTSPSSSWTYTTAARLQASIGVCTVFSSVRHKEKHSNKDLTNSINYTSS